MPKSKKTQKKKKPTKAIPIQVVTQMLTLATSGFGLGAALAWNSLIQNVINVYVKKYLPSGSDAISQLIYALSVTVRAVIVTL